MENKKLRIGIIGTGRISVAHIGGIKESRNGVITAICDIDEEKLNKTGDSLGIPQEYRFKNYMDLINCDIVDAVEICTPNYLHVPMAAEVVKAGKPVNIEKPLSCTCDDVHILTDELEKNPQPNMMCFSYRFYPAVRFAKYIIDKGMLGEVVTVSIEYLQSGSFIEGRRLEWRFDKKLSGTGAIGDLGVHLIDMTRYLLGDITGVSARKGTVVKKRMKLDSDEWADVTTDDYCTFIADIEGGATASFTVTRCAHGHSNTIKYDIFGKDGVISFNLNNPEEIGICLGEIDVKAGGLHTVRVPEQFRASQEQTFIDIALGEFEGAKPDIYEGIKCQKILDAIDKSSDMNTWIKIK
ncbi:MAG: Gfo/Idh/MocA family protein [Monoglobaceae bacterium]